MTCDRRARGDLAAFVPVLGTTPARGVSAQRARTTDGSSAYYVIDCLSPEPSGQVGPDMSLHNMEIAYTFAMGMFFTSDPRAEVRYRKRFATAFRRALTVDLNGRSYSWAFQASSQLVYFVMNPGRGAPA
jgi:hypothetical protein